MPHNLLVTGPPRSGKTTVVNRAVDRLEARGYRVGGVASPERRANGERVGFDIRDAMTGETATLAHVDRATCPPVGRYRVDVDAVEALSQAAFHRASEHADVTVVDEIAPMEVASESFVDHVRQALDDVQPVLATVHYRSSSGFIGAVKDRDDTTVVEVSRENRDGLPAELASGIVEWLAA